MALMERGKVLAGKLVLSGPLELPDGTEVVVHIEPLPPGQKPGTRAACHSRSETEARAGEAVPEEPRSLADLECFGMWADREEMEDSAAWVRRQREQWHLRAAPRD